MHRDMYAYVLWIHTYTCGRCVCVCVVAFVHTSSPLLPFLTVHDMTRIEVSVPSECGCGFASRTSLEVCHSSSAATTASFIYPHAQMAASPQASAVHTKEERTEEDQVMRKVRERGGGGG